jgi:peptidoglycan DL-endopeptidase CwlO
MSHRIPRPSAAPVAAVVAALALALLAGLATGPSAHATPGRTAPVQTARLNPLDPATLTAARREADRLRATMDRISDQQDAAEERLAYVRDLLAVASTRAITTEQQLALLTEQTATIGDTATERVRALYMSGGAPALYSTLLDGDDISDVLSRVTTVQDVLRGDDTALDDSQAELSAVTELRAQQARVARQRAQLSGEATALVRRLATLHRSATRALAHADARVERLAEVLRRQRQAAAEAAAARALEAYGATPFSNRPASGTPYGDAAVAAALSKLGSPYVWGAEGPDTFDCSGLVQWAYAQAGLSLPRLASDQYFASRPVDVSQMLPGDVLVYAYQPGVESTIHHITMYIGNGQMVHAPHTGDVVRVVPVYFDGLYGVARPGLAP